jgi:hypothetical protein
MEVDLMTVESTHLGQILTNFYAEAAPKVTTARKMMLPEAQAEEYHTNTLRKCQGCY